MAENRTGRFIATSAKGLKIDYGKAIGPNLLAQGAQSKRTGGIHAPVQPSAELGAIVGSSALPRSEIVSKVWTYIKLNKLQNPENKREILADAKLKKVFGKERVTMFEMNKHLNANISTTFSNGTVKKSA